MIRDMENGTDFLDKLARLHCDRPNGRPRPHKAVMLLSVSLLAEAGDLAENKIVYDTRLLEIFRNLFTIARQDSDQFTPYNPFFHLKSEGFWYLVPNLGMEDRLKHLKQVKGPGELREVVAWATLDPRLHMLLLNPQTRHEFQAVLIQHYMNHAGSQMWAALKEETLIANRQKELLSDSIPANDNDKPIDRVRSAAFRRMIREIYDVRCAACGVRFFFEDVDLIDAAHLIPFSDGGDDRPQNGIALCKNHHWLMDNAILAPGPGGRGSDYTHPVWHVRKGLDERFEEHRTVLELRGKTVIPPRDGHFIPARDSLDWRMEQLRRCSITNEMDYAE